MSEPTLYIVRGGGAHVPPPPDDLDFTPVLERRRPFWVRFVVGAVAILFVLMLLGYAVWVLTEPPR